MRRELSVRAQFSSSYEVIKYLEKRKNNNLVFNNHWWANLMNDNFPDVGFYQQT